MAESTHGTRLSIFTWGVYVGAIGAALLVIPDTFTDLFGMDQPRDVWARIAGIVLLVLAAYYFGAALHRARWLYWYSVPVRILAAIALIVFAITESIWQLFLFAAVDLVGAGWTFAGLRWRPPPEPLEPTAEA